MVTNTMTHQLMRLAWVLASCFLLLTGCATTKTALKQDVDMMLNTNEGYLLIGIDTNQDLTYLNFDGETKLQFTQDDLRKGSSYILTTVPVGKYYIKSVGTGYRYQVRLKKEHWGFEVKPQQISYIGDLSIQRHRIFSWIFYAKMKNRSSSAVKFLQDEFPNILNNRQLHYAGPGNDRFLRYYYKYIKQQTNDEEVKS